MVILLLIAALASATLGGTLAAALGTGLLGALLCAVAASTLGTLAVAFAAASRQGDGGRPARRVPGANSEPELVVVH